MGPERLTPKFAGALGAIVGLTISGNCTFGAIGGAGGDDAGAESLGGGGKEVGKADPAAVVVIGGAGAVTVNDASVGNQHLGCESLSLVILVRWMDC